MKSHAFRLHPGQDLRLSIEQYASEHSIEAGWIASCVGSLTRYHLRFANNSIGTKGEGHFEMINLNGTLAVNGMHLHMMISDEQGLCIGGHLLEGNIIFTTAEIILIEEENYLFERIHDEMTGCKELEIHSRIEEF